MSLLQAEFIEKITMAELEKDPYPFYKRLRYEVPVAWVPVLDAWVVTRWDECESIGLDEKTWQKADPRGMDSTLAKVTERVVGLSNVLNVDGPEHADQRSGIDPRLEAREVLGYVDDLVQPIAARYARALADRGTADLSSEYFSPVSVEALRHVMGLDKYIATETLVRWFHALSDGAMNVALDEGVFERADQVNAELRVALEPVLADLRANPDHTMLSHMIFAGREGLEPRTVEEILPSIRVLLTGGMQEPGHGAAATMLGLLENPEQLAEVVEDPDLIPTAVYEGLRWLSPAAFTERYALGDHQFGNVVIRDGDMVMLVLASANRDETRFDRPDEFDINRTRKPNQAFGHGKHLCAGNFFGRQVERIMLEELLEVIPGVGLDPRKSPTVHGWGFRAPKSLPVCWTVGEA